jgi:hypothetical protein
LAYLFSKNMADIPILLVAAAIVGAGLNVARGALHEPKTDFSWRKALGGLIAGGIGALAAVQLIDISGIGQVGIALIGILAGFGSDYGFSKLKK